MAGPGAARWRRSPRRTRREGGNEPRRVVRAGIQRVGRALATPLGAVGLEYTIRAVTCVLG
jgi:hypothetical protein